jgi:hypothetical protein
VEAQVRGVGEVVSVPGTELHEEPVRGSDALEDAGDHPVLAALGVDAALVALQVVEHLSQHRRPDLSAESRPGS